MSKNPYVGPRTFERSESEYFFGRDREAQELAARVTSKRLLVFYAQSGAGKSSLINAKLISLLEDEEYSVLPVARVSNQLAAKTAAKSEEIRESVKNIYMFNLMMSIDRGNDEEKTAERIQEYSSLNLSDFLARLVTYDGQEYHYDKDVKLSEPASADDVPVASGGRYVLIIDQFEELLSTNRGRWQDRDDFFIQLRQALADDPYLHIVLALREDYWGGLEGYAHLVPGRFRARFYMQRLSKKAAIKAVKNPARLGGRPFAPDVAEGLVDDLARINELQPDGQTKPVPGKDVEPVHLQLVCFSLWDQLPPDPFGITKADLRAIGDLDAPFADFYADSVAEIAEKNDVEEEVIRNWIEKELITPGGIRSQVLLDEKAGESGGLDNQVIKMLEEKRLVKLVDRRGAKWYELAHDRLVEPVRAENARWKIADLNADLKRQRKNTLLVIAISLLVVAVVLLAAYADSKVVRTINYPSGDAIEVSASGLIFPKLAKKWQFTVERQSGGYMPLVIISAERDGGLVGEYLDPLITITGQGITKDTLRIYEDSQGVYRGYYRPEISGTITIEARGRGASFGPLLVTAQIGELSEMAKLSSHTTDAKTLCGMAIEEEKEFKAEHAGGILGNDVARYPCSKAVWLGNSDLDEETCTLLRSNRLDLSNELCPIDVRALPSDTVISGVITTTIGPNGPEGSADYYSLEGQAGDVVFIKMNAAESSTLDPHLKLIGPGEDVIKSEHADDGATSKDVFEEFTLKVGGKYQLVASGLEDSSGAYQLTWSKGTLAELVQTVDDPQLAFKNCTYFISEDEVEKASPWCRRAVELSEETGDVNLALLKLCRSKRNGWQENEACKELILRANRIERGQAITFALEPGSQEHWWFEGHAGQYALITVDTDIPDELDPVLNIYGPSGQVLVKDENEDGDLKAQMPLAQLPESGLYLIETKTSSNTIGQYNLSLFLGTTLSELTDQISELKDATHATDLCVFGAEKRLPEIDEACKLATDLATECVFRAEKSLTEDDTGDCQPNSGLVAKEMAQSLNSRLCFLQRQGLMLEEASDACGYLRRIAPQIHASEPITDRFNAGSPDTWSYDSDSKEIVTIVMTKDANSDFFPLLSLYSPNDDVPVAQDTDLWDQDGKAQIGPFALPEVGQYGIEARADSSTSSGGYVLEVKPIAADDFAKEPWWANAHVTTELCLNVAMADYPPDVVSKLCERAVELAIDHQDFELISQLCALNREDSTSACEFVEKFTLGPEYEAVRGETGPDSPESWLYQGRAGQAVYIKMTADPTSVLDPYLVLSRPNGGSLVEAYDSYGEHNAQLSWPDIPLFAHDGDPLVIQASSFIGTGSYTLTVVPGTITETVALVAETGNALTNNSMCWIGSIDGFAETVLPACERAVQLAEETGDDFLYGIRDSRGLARALTGDYAGAIEDFEFFIARTSDDYLREQREGWLPLLRAGEFPMNDALREELRFQ